MKAKEIELAIKENSSLKLATMFTLEELENIREDYNAKRAAMLEDLESLTGNLKQHVQTALFSLNGSRVKIHKAISMLQVQAKEDKQMHRKSYTELKNFYNKAKARLSPILFEELDGG